MEEKEKTTKEQPITEKVKERTEKLISRILDEGIKMENIDFLYKMIDIHKDISNEDYWEAKKEGMKMRYKAYSEGSYGKYEDNRYGANYSRGGYSAGGGNFSAGGSYGRRGVKGTGRGRYRGGEEEAMEEMMYHYGNYSEGSSYGAEGEAMESLSKLMESAYEYFKELKENANSQEEVKMMEHYFKKMGQM